MNLKKHYIIRGVFACAYVATYYSVNTLGMAFDVSLSLPPSPGKTKFGNYLGQGTLDVCVGGKGFRGSG